MNALELLNLKAGTLFKGIDNSLIGKSILSVSGWKNPYTNQSYVIRWLKEEKLKDLKFVTFDHRISTLDERLEYFKTFIPGTNYQIYDTEHLGAVFDLKTIQIGSPIGMFLGESIFCIKDKKHTMVLLKILDIKEIGWIVLGCENTTKSAREQFDIY